MAADEAGGTDVRQTALGRGCVGFDEVAENGGLDLWGKAIDIHGVNGEEDGSDSAC